MGTAAAISHTGQLADTKMVLAFVKARYAIKLARDAGRPRDQWTKDPILARYKFCHVHREDDRITRWVAANWRGQHATDPDLWFALTVFRRGINWPDTAQELGYPVPWNGKRYITVCTRREQRGEVVFASTAYKLIVPATPGPLAEQQVRCIFDPLWKDREHYRPHPQDTLASFYGRLVEAPGMGSFLAAQVVADLKYVQLRKASDWWTFAASGPGSRRGLNRVLGRPVDAPWRRESDWYAELRKLQIALDPLVKAAGIPRLHAADWQNVLCEVDKRERVRLGEGKVREYIPYKGRER